MTKMNEQIFNNFLHDFLGMAARIAVLDREKLSRIESSFVEPDSMIRNVKNASYAHNFVIVLERFLIAFPEAAKEFMDLHGHEEHVQRALEFFNISSPHLHQYFDEIIRSNIVLPERNLNLDVSTDYLMNRISDEYHLIDFVRDAAKFRLIFPDKFSEIDISRVTLDEAREVLDGYRSDCNLKKFLDYAYYFQIVFAKDARIDDGKIVIVKQAESFKKSIKKPRPERKSF